MGKDLLERDLQRYDRQMLIPNWGRGGQLRLKNAIVTVAGTGGLGCPVSVYLAAAGVGHLLLLDNDCFELSNLNRQILGWEKDIGRPKTAAAQEKLHALNSDIEVEARQVEITATNVCDLIKRSDVVVDAMDNWRTRFILNQGCVDSGIPLVHAGIQGMNGQLTTIVPGRGPCLNCILPRAPPEVKAFPVVGVTPGLFAMLQVMETIKLIVGIGQPLVGKLLLFSGDDMSFSTVEVSRNPKCPVCMGA